MATAYTPILQLALPVTGELQGTWGTVVNDNITSMIEQAIAGLATINTWTTASHTLTTANGTTDEARCAVLECSGAPGAAATVICPASTKLYVIKNSVTGGYAVTLKTSAGTGISVPNGSTALLYCDGTNVVSGATYMATVSTTQVDILAQGDLRLQDSTGGEYVALQAPATIATSYTLTLPVDDGTAGQALITDGSGVLSWSTAASGDVYGPASATDNAVARYDGTTGKIIQNSAVTIDDDGATVIAANSASDGLRITQIGAGNALVVEDSSNPDATPFVVNASGQVIQGYTANITSYAFQSNSANPFSGIRWAGAATGGPTLLLGKSRSATVGTQGVVSSGDTLGIYSFSGDDGTAFIQAASISSSVDGTPGTNDMPGRLVFSTTADGASSVTERMRIDSAGQVGIGGVASIGTTLRVGKNVTGAINSLSVYNNPTILSDVTSVATLYGAFPSTTAAAFSLANLYYYSASQNTIGAGSSIGTQIGFNAQSSLTGATNNYGFYGNIASGTGRYNFYANGTADNYFAGNVGVGTTTPYAQLEAWSSITTPTGGEATGIGSVRITNGATALSSTGGLEFKIAGDTSGYGSKIQALNSSGVQLVFANRNNSATWSEYMRIGSTGIISLGAAPGSESLRVTPVASAVNYWQFYGATTGGSIAMYATGSNTNISIDYISKGTGAHYFSSNAPSSSAQFAITNTTSAVNYLQVTGSATGNRFNLSAQGSDTNVGMNFSAKGAENFVFSTSAGTAPQFLIAHTASAVNYLSVTGSSTSNAPNIAAAGSDTNINLVYITKGTGAHYFQTSSTNQFVVSHTASAVNYLQVTGAATGAHAFIQSQGSDTNVGFDIVSKNFGSIRFYTNSYAAAQFRITSTTSAVNNIDATGATTGNAPTFSVTGSDTNIDLALTPKGTGNVRFGTLTANADAPITGYILIKDSGGTTRKLAVIA